MPLVRPRPWALEGPASIDEEALELVATAYAADDLRRISELADEWRAAFLCEATTSGSESFNEGSPGDQKSQEGIGEASSSLMVHRPTSSGAPATRDARAARRFIDLKRTFSIEQPANNPSMLGLGEPEIPKTLIVAFAHARRRPFTGTDGQAFWRYIDDGVIRADYKLARQRKAAEHTLQHLAKVTTRQATAELQRMNRREDKNTGTKKTRRRFRE